MWKKSLSAQAIESLQTTNWELGEAVANVETVEDLEQTATQASDAIHSLETSLTEARLKEILGTMDDPTLNPREVWGLDWADYLAKLTELDEHIHGMEKHWTRLTLGVLMSQTLHCRKPVWTAW